MIQNKPIFLFLYGISLFLVWHIFEWYLTKPRSQWITIFNYSNTTAFPALVIHWLGGISILLVWPWVYKSAGTAYHKYLGRVFIFGGCLPASIGGLWHLALNESCSWLSFFMYGLALFFVALKTFSSAGGAQYAHSVWGKRLLVLSLSSLTFRVLLLPIVLGGSLQLFNIDNFAYKDISLYIASLLMWFPSIYYEGVLLKKIP